MEAAPGSGKTFFVKEKTFFVKELFGELTCETKVPGIVAPKQQNSAATVFREVNIGSYPSIDAASSDVVLEILVTLARHRAVMLFIDEVDTKIGNDHMFQKLLALMNGEPLVLLNKKMVFSDVNLIMVFALSSDLSDVMKMPKGPDFLSRIPRARQLVLPALNNPRERWVRVIGVLAKTAPVTISRQALLYLGLRS